MKRLEKTFIVLSIIALIMMFTQAQGSLMMFVISVIGLIIIYLALGFLFFSEISFRQVFKGALKTKSGSLLAMSAITGVALSILSLGILFRILHYPGANEMLILGLGIALIMSVIAFVNYRKSKSSTSALALSRLLVYITISTLLLFTSSETILRLQFRDHPQYVDAYLDYQHNPTPETEARKRKEYMRMVLPAEEFSRFYESGE